MMVMLCRNRVADFSQWKGVFDSHAQAHRDAGLHLKGIWRAVDEPNNVFFLFEVTDDGKARAFINNPAAAEAAKTSGVLDGEYHFLESSTGY
ncbi:MAG: hypothetical protein ABSG32_09800 [Terriglobia bacterium]|jgi:hypothetical protein